jgi:sugar phosphate isomerase/epimerase
MRLAISNIAWPTERESIVANELSRLGVHGVEVAPTKTWPRPLEATERDATAYRNFWEQHGLPIIALQALLFERPDLRLFGDARQRAEMTAYLAGIFRLASWLGAEVLVFGSPKNRLRGQLTDDETSSVAVPFFRELGRLAVDQDVTLCIEPNPSAYGCDYVTRAAEGIELVRAVNHPGFGLHLDAAGMTLSGDDPATIFSSALPCWRHFHVSEPCLAPVGSGMDHQPLASALRASGYHRWVSIEMKVPPAGFSAENIEQAVGVVREKYLGGNCAVHSFAAQTRVSPSSSTST